MTEQELPLGNVSGFGEVVINVVELVIPFNWAVALLSGATCVVLVYIMGHLYQFSWRLIVALSAASMALNFTTPLITPDQPWASSLAVVASNLVVALVVARRLHKDGYFK